MKKRATIVDIAKEAHSSAATVSRVLSGSDYPVSSELRTRILAIAAKMNYTPNIYSQILRGRTNREIGVIVPSITNPFYAQLVSSIEKECLRRGYVLVICSSQNNTKFETEHLNMLIRKQVVGILLSSIHLDDTFLKPLQESDIPFVLFDQPCDTYSGDSVSFDFYKAGYIATEYLLNCGHRDIAFASGPIDRLSRKQLLAGFKQALRDKGVRFNQRRLILNSDAASNVDAEHDTYCGQQLAAAMLQDDYLPDAVLAVNDMIAIGIIKYMESQGVYIPVDLSVIGMDNIYISELVVPALTTVNQPAGETGRLAANILMDRVEAKQSKPQQVVLQPALIERDSVRKVHRKVKR